MKKKLNYTHTNVEAKVQPHQPSLLMVPPTQLLSPGKTIEQSWIQHSTLLDVNVEIVAKHYPTLLDETSHRVQVFAKLNLKTWR